MAKYKSIVITNAGLELIAATHDGGTIEFTGIKTGNGTYDGSEVLADMTDLKSEQQSFGITGLTRTTAVVKVRSVLTNNDLAAGYYITEIGLYAMESNTSTEVLYAIIVAESGMEDYLPPYADSPQNITLEMYISAVGTEDVNFTASIIPGTYVTAEDFNDFRINNAAKLNFKADQVDLEQTNQNIASLSTELNEKINTAQSTADTATNIAKGKNQARVFLTTEKMYEWLSDATNKGVAQKGDNIYIIDVGVPDWWIAEVLETPNADGRYYEIAHLETQKVDLNPVIDAIKELDAVDKENFNYLGRSNNLFNNTATSTTKDGITWTVNADKSVTAVGVASADTSFSLSGSFVIPTDVIFSGCPNNGSKDTFYMFLTLFNGSMTTNYYEVGDGCELKLAEGKTGTCYSWSLQIKSGTDLGSGITFYPMMRRATEEDDTYEPYHYDRIEKLEKSPYLFHKEFLLSDFLGSSGQTFSVYADSSFSGSPNFNVDLKSLLPSGADLLLYRRTWCLYVTSINTRAGSYNTSAYSGALLLHKNSSGSYVSHSRGSSSEDGTAYTDSSTLRITSCTRQRVYGDEHKAFGFTIEFDKDISSVGATNYKIGLMIY